MDLESVIKHNCKQPWYFSSSLSSMFRIRSATGSVDSASHSPRTKAHPSVVVGTVVGVTAVGQDTFKYFQAVGLLLSLLHIECLETLDFSPE